MASSWGFVPGGGVVGSLARRIFRFEAGKSLADPERWRAGFECLSGMRRLVLRRRKNEGEQNFTLHSYFRMSNRFSDQADFIKDRALETWLWLLCISSKLERC